ncbi:MAG: ABC transporter transmembrane domain-containing protein [Pseudomonadota bacterium]
MKGHRSTERPRVGTTVVLATLSLNILALAMPLVILQIFDRVISNSSTQTLALLVLGLLIVIGFETILRTARVVLLSSVSETYELDLTAKFVGRTLAADPSVYAKTTEAEHLERFAAIGRLRDFYAGQGRLANLELPFAVLFIAMIGLIGGWLIVVPIIGVILLLWFMTILVRYQEPIFEERNTLDARRYAFLIEILSQIGSIKLNTMEKQMLRRFEMMQSKAIENSRWAILFSGLSQSFGAVYAQAALIAMGLFGGFLVIRGNIGMAELAACMLLNGRTIQPFVKMLGVWAQSESIAASNKKLSAALTVPTPALVKGPASSLETGRIDIIGLTVSEGEAASPVFDRLNVAVHAGDCMSIIGEDDNGKSTLLKTIMGEVVPEAGEVLIDGQPVSPVWPPRGKDGIAMVGMHPVIFNGTILQNISAFGDGDNIEHALELSHVFGLEDRVHRLPMGYNTSLGENSRFVLDASSLKLVTLVRAFVVKPKVLLLQDPTRGIDLCSRLKLATHISQGLDNTTVVAATHDDLLIGASADTLLLQNSAQEDWHDDLRAEALSAQQTSMAS